MLNFHYRSGDGFTVVLCFWGVGFTLASWRTLLVDFAMAGLLILKYLNPNVSSPKTYWKHVEVARWEWELLRYNFRMTSTRPLLWNSGEYERRSCTRSDSQFADSMPWTLGCYGRRLPATRWTHPRSRPARTHDRQRFKYDDAHGIVVDRSAAAYATLLVCCELPTLTRLEIFYASFEIRFAEQQQRVCFAWMRHVTWNWNMYFFRHESRL